jgi:hypothetical protein
LNALLDGLDVDWCVVGGWSIDLFLGQPSREHHDLEIAIQRADLPAIRRHLSGFVFHAVQDGTVQRLAPDQPGPPQKRQHWVLDESAREWRLDVMVEPGDREWWVYRRDERIRRRREQMVGRTVDGVPYLRPEGALLYKAKSLHPKDESDLAACLPHLEPDAMAWLRDALETVQPGHPWLERLGPPQAD